jgi:hypothetical protein
VSPNLRYDFTVYLPTVYNASYSRFVVLSGYDFSITNVLDFNLWLQPYSSDSTADVRLLVLDTISFNKLSIFVVMVIPGSWITLSNTSIYTEIQHISHQPYSVAPAQAERSKFFL